MSTNLQLIGFFFNTLISMLIVMCLKQYRTTDVEITAGSICEEGLYVHLQWIGFCVSAQQILFMLISTSEPTGERYVEEKYIRVT